MSDRAPDPGPRSMPLPPDTERDTRLLYLFRPAALPWVLITLMWAVVFVAWPFPGVVKRMLGAALPAGVLGALAADAPERLARRRRYWRDGPERYQGQATPGNVRAQYPAAATLGVALEVLPPPCGPCPFGTAPRGRGRVPVGREADRDAPWIGPGAGRHPAPPRSARDGADGPRGQGRPWPHLYGSGSTPPPPGGGGRAAPRPPRGASSRPL